MKIKPPSLGSIVWHGMHPGIDPLPLWLPLPESDRRPYCLDRQRRGERAPRVERSWHLALSTSVSRRSARRSCLNREPGDGKSTVVQTQNTRMDMAKDSRICPRRRSLHALTRSGLDTMGLSEACVARTDSRDFDRRD